MPKEKNSSLSHAALATEFTSSLKTWVKETDKEMTRLQQRCQELEAQNRHYERLVTAHHLADLHNSFVGGDDEDEGEDEKPLTAKAIEKLEAYALRVVEAYPTKLRGKKPLRWEGSSQQREAQLQCDAKN
jgi:hypothetical protein